MNNAASQIPGPSSSSGLRLIAAGAAFAGIVWIMLAEVNGTSGRGQAASRDSAKQEGVVRRLVEWRDGMADVSARVVKDAVVVTILQGDGPRDSWVITNEFQMAVPGAETIREIRTDATQSGRLFAAINVLTATESQVLVVSLLPERRRRVGSALADSGTVVMRGPRARRILGFSYVSGSGLNLTVGTSPRMNEGDDGQLQAPSLSIEGTIGFDPCPWPVSGMYSGPFQIDLKP